MNRRSDGTLGRALTAVLAVFIAGAAAHAEQEVRFECAKPGACFLTNELAIFEAVVEDGTAVAEGRLRIIDYENRVLFERSKDYIFKGSGPSGEGWQAKRESDRWQVTGTGIGQGYYIAQWLPSGTEEVAGYLRFVIIEPRDYYGASPFAMDAAFSWFVTDPEQLRQAGQLLRAAGVDWVRDRFAWGHVQPVRDSWDWSRYDATLQLQHEVGLQVAQVFHDTAVWSAAAPQGAAHPERYLPKDLNDLSLFLSRTVERYKDWVPVWEVWNEMDSRTFFEGTPGEYVALLHKAYRAIKGANPSALVLLGSVCLTQGEPGVQGAMYSEPEGVGFVEKIFECGAGDYFDVYNFHYYGPVDGLLDRFKIDYEFLQRYGQATKPVWLTEVGLPSAQFSSEEVLPSERRQAGYLVKAYALGLSLGVEKVFFFLFPTFLEHGVSHWGIYDHRPEQGWTPKPAYVALAEITHLLREGRSVGRVEIGATLRGVLFEVGNESVLVLWSLRPEGSTLRVPEGGNLLVRDLLGRSVELQADRTLEVTHAPLYLSGDLKPLVQQGRLVPPVCGRELPKAKPLGPYTLRFRCQPNVAAIGDRVRYDVQIYNETLFPRKGEMVFTTSRGRPTSHWVPGLFVVEAGGLFETSFEMELQSASTGEEVQTVTLFEEGREVAKAKAFLDIVNPIEIVSARLVADERPADLLLEVVLDNHSSKQRDVRLGLRPTSRVRGFPRLERFRLEGIAPLEQKRFQFPLPAGMKPGQRYALLSEETEYEYYLDSPYVNLHERAMEIDGKPDVRDLSLWHLWKQDQCVVGRDVWDGVQDLSGEVAVALAGQALYVAGTVMDDDRCASIGREQPWTGDAVELFLDFRTQEQGKPAYGPGVFQLFLVAPSTLVPEGRLVMWQPAKEEIRDAPFAFRTQRGGYDFEVLIPLHHFGLEEMRPGRRFGIDIVLDDRDFYEGRFKQMAWQGTNNNWRDPSRFAKVVVVR